MRGIIDFHKAKLDDVAWWRRTGILIESMAKDDDRVIMDASIKFHGCLLSNSRLEDTSFKKHSEEIISTFNDLLANIRPWAHKEGSKQREQMLQSLVDAYKQHWPDPSDPKVKEAMVEEHKQFLAERKKLVTEETLDQRIDRIADERAAVLRKRREEYAGKRRRL